MEGAFTKKIRQISAIDLVIEYLENNQCSNFSRILRDGNFAFMAENERQFAVILAPLDSVIGGYMHISRTEEFKSVVLNHLSFKPLNIAQPVYTSINNITLGSSIEDFHKTVETVSIEIIDVITVIRINRVIITPNQQNRINMPMDALVKGSQLPDDMENILLSKNYLGPSDLVKFCLDNKEVHAKFCNGPGNVFQTILYNEYKIRDVNYNEAFGIYADINYLSMLVVENLLLKRREVLPIQVKKVEAQKTRIVVLIKGKLYRLFLSMVNNPLKLLYYIDPIVGFEAGIKDFHLIRTSPVNTVLYTVDYFGNHRASNMFTQEGYNNPETILIVNDKSSTVEYAENLYGIDVALLINNETGKVTRLFSNHVMSELRIGMMFDVKLPVPMKYYLAHNYVLAYVSTDNRLIVSTYDAPDDMGNKVLASYDLGDLSVEFRRLVVLTTNKVIFAHKNKLHMFIFKEHNEPLIHFNNYLISIEIPAGVQRLSLRGTDLLISFKSSPLMKFSLKSLDMRPSEEPKLYLTGNVFVTRNSEFDRATNKPTKLGPELDLNVIYTFKGTERSKTVSSERASEAIFVSQAL